MTTKCKFLKPVINNGTPESALQFKVKKDLEASKKVKSKNVFEYNNAKRVKTAKRSNKRLKKKSRSRSDLISTSGASSKY